MNRIFPTEGAIVEGAIAIFKIMQLTPAEFTNDYPFLRLVSENQVWEFGIGKLTITGGIRIVAGKIGSRCFEVSYCAGNDRGMALVYWPKY